MKYLQLSPGGDPGNGQANGSLVGYLASFYPDIPATTSIINPQGDKVGAHDVPAGLVANIIKNHV
jgi:hypothetical protein